MNETQVGSSIKPNLETIETHSYDVVIVGAGGAGLRAAIAASETSQSVAVISKSLLGKAHTVMAEGGVAASLGNVDADDSWDTHFYDTIKSGHFINQYQMVELYAKEVPDRVIELEDWGAVFDRTPAGKIMQRPFGAHSFRRLAHIGDRTGKELIRTLQYKVIHQNVDIFQEVTTTRLLTDGTGRIAGVFGYYREDGRFVVFRAKAVVLATGGFGKAYKVTSNSWESTGDGAAMAFRAGAELMDMEMVQFHPTGMVWPPGVRGLLVTEGVRGEGGLLYNSQHERFMLRYDPVRRELSSRDVVARSIFKENQAGHGTPHGGAWLDISHLPAQVVKSKLPGMYEQFLSLADVDITREPFEVAPTTHYVMGGIRVHPETAATNVLGLYAAGEVACGLHGANRLGGNSLGDILVFGRRAGMAASAYATSVEFAPLDAHQLETEAERVLAPFGRSDGEQPYRLMAELQEIMTTYAGIVRSGEGLEQGLDHLELLKQRASRMSVPGSRAYNPGWHTVFDVESLILLGEAVIRGALARKESRGAQWRTDYPDELPEMGALNFVQTWSEGTVAVQAAAVPEMPERLSRLFESDQAPGVLRQAERSRGQGGAS
jgi:succinate dehydrogenase / fumarate reductase flavoprotein subunit